MIPRATGASGHRMRVRGSWTAAARTVLVLILMVQLGVDTVSASHPNRVDPRRSAVWAAYTWMVRQSGRQEVVAEYGTDFMEFYYELSTSARDPRLREAARLQGRTATLRYLRIMGPASNPTEALDLISAASLSEEFGIRSPLLARLAHQAGTGFDFEDLYSVHPGVTIEDPDVICDAIICLHFARRADLTDGEALQWAISLARTHVYGDPRQMEPDDVIDQDNLVTHVVYVLSDYGRLSLAGCALTREREYMIAQLPRVVRQGDVELTSEFVDSLRILGVGDEHRAVSAARSWLLTVQNPDGSFGDPGAEDFYDRYHSTWTALNALRDFRFQGRGPRWPGVTCIDP